MVRFELITAAVSLSSKEDGGEDRVRTIGRAHGPIGVVVCDGVGSVPESAAMAEEVRDLAAALISGHELEPAIWNLDERLQDALPAGREGKTTMAVVCAEARGVVGHMLLGNGSILEVVPMEVEPGKVRLLWTSIALPQMGGRDGRPALRSFLPPDSGRVEAEKGVRIAPGSAPRLYLACSDGFLSEEDRLEGSAPDGTVWCQVPRFAAQLLEQLTGSWGDLLAQEPEEVTATLQGLIERAIQEPLTDELLDDDTTVGVLYMRPVAGTENGGTR